MNFELVGEITNIEIIAIGNHIRDLSRLRKMYGQGRWRKLKGIANIKLKNGRIRLVELHWSEAHGIGKKEIKRKHYLDSYGSVTLSEIFKFDSPSRRSGF